MTSDEFLNSFYRPKVDISLEYSAGHDEFAEMFPAIFEFLARCRVGGKERQTARLSLWAAAQKAHLCLNDKESVQICFVQATGFQEALTVLNSGLETRTIAWQQDKNRTPY